MNGADNIQNYNAVFPAIEYRNRGAGDAALLQDAAVPAEPGREGQEPAPARPAFNQMMDAEGVRELFTQSRLLEDGKTNDLTKERLEEQLETLRAVAALKRKLMEGAGRLSRTAVQELLAGGVSLEKISFGILTDMMAGMDMADDMPANEAERAGAEERLEQVRGLNDRSIAMLLKEDKPLSFENVYAARFASGGRSRAREAGNAGKALDEAALKALEAETLKVFDREGVEANEETLGIARFLLENDVPVTGENVDKTRFLRELPGGGGLAERMARHLRQGGGLWQFDMYEPGAAALSGAPSGAEPGAPGAELNAALNEKYTALALELPRIRPEKVDILLRSRAPLTLYNLRTAPDTAGHEAAADMEAAAAATEAGRARGAAKPDTDSAEGKRLLAEIQLAMTLSAARRLAGKGIDIDTMPLREALERLKAAAEEGYAANLRAMRAEPSAENVSAMSRLYSRMAGMNPLTNNVFAGLLKQAAPFTVAGVHEAVAFARLRENYDAFATVPNPKYGDSFAKVRGEFSALLERIGVEPTDRNVKAAAILSRSGIDVAPEALEQVSLIDAKIDYVRNRLHPNIAAVIIKEGANPLDMHIDELIAAIDSFDNIYGENLKDKIASHIMALDGQKTLEPRERAAMLAIYRMLAATQRNGGAALGVALKNGASLTLGSMLEASKYYGRAKAENGGTLDFDFSVDEDFGGLLRLNARENSISAMFRSPDDFALEQFVRQAAPQALARFIGNEPGHLNMPLAQAAAELRQIKDDLAAQAGRDEDNEDAARDIDHSFEQLERLFKTKPTTIHFMEQHGVPPTATNAAAMSALREDPFFLGRALDRLKKDLKAKAADAEIDAADGESAGETLAEDTLALMEAGQTPGDVMRALHDRLETLKQAQSSAELIDRFNLIQNAIKVQNHTQSQREQAEVKLPVALSGGKIANLNMYVLNDAFTDGASGRVLLSLNTQNCGNVQVIIDTEGEKLRLAVHSDDPAALKRLEAGADGLLARLRELGFQPDALRFGVEEARNTLDEDMRPKVDLSAYAAKYEARV